MDLRQALWRGPAANAKSCSGKLQNQQQQRDRGCAEQAGKEDALTGKIHVAIILRGQHQAEYSAGHGQVEHDHAWGKRVGVERQQVNEQQEKQREQDQARQRCAEGLLFTSCARLKPVTSMERGVVISAR